MDFWGQSHSFVSEFVKSPKFYSWLNVVGLRDFFEPPLLKKGPEVLSLGKARHFLFLLFSQAECTQVLRNQARACHSDFFASEVKE